MNIEAPISSNYTPNLMSKSKTPSRSSQPKSKARVSTRNAAILIISTVGAIGLATVKIIPATLGAIFTRPHHDTSTQVQSAPAVQSPPAVSQTIQGNGNFAPVNSTTTINN